MKNDNSLFVIRTPPKKILLVPTLSRSCVYNVSSNYVRTDKGHAKTAKSKSRVPFTC